jgi:alpha-glucosidase
LVFAAAAEAGQAELYEDSGDGYAFEDGQLARTQLTCRVEEGSVEVQLGAQTGSFDPGRKTVELDVRGVGLPSQVLVDGVVTATWQHADARLQIRLPWTPAARMVEIRAATV